MSSDPPTNGSAAFGILFKVGFVVVVLVAAFFIYRSMTLQSTAKQATDERTQMQTQLELARADLSKAETSTRELTDEATKLHSQLEAVQKEVSGAKASAEKATAEAARLRSQLEQARSEAASAKANAAKANADLAKLQAEMQAQAAPQSQSQPQAEPQSAPAMSAPAPAQSAATASKQMPLTVSFRKAIVGGGTGVVLQNTSGGNLSVKVTFSTPTGDRSKEYQVVVEGGAEKELGSLGAWLLASGDKVAIESAGYETIVRTTP